MIEAQIPKDIRKYESKLVGPFTLRQLICFIIACVLALLAFRILKPLIGSSNASTICLIIGIPPIAFGWVKPYGMTLEKFLQSALIGNVLAPKKRKYKTRNTFRKVETKLEKMNDKEFKKRIKMEQKLAKTNKKYIAYK
jgi:hypothetical protein